MANVKITELTAATALAGTDVLPIVDVGADATKKVSVSDLLRNLPDGTASAPALAFADDQNTGVLSPAANELAFATSGTQRLVIDSSGNCGIGTSSPASGRKLHVSGTGTSVQIDSSNTSNLIKFTNSAASVGFIGYQSDNLVFYTNNSEQLRIDSSGNVGIGDSNPSNKLVVKDSGSPTIEINGQGRAASLTLGVTASESKLFEGSNNALAFGTNNTERLRINSSGNVGIGTASPDQKLHIVGNYKGVNSSGQGVQIVNTTTPYIQSLGTSTVNDLMVSSKTLRVETGTSYSTSERLRIDSSGRLLIGTTTGDGQLEVRSNAALGIISRAINTQGTDTNKAFKARNNSDTDTFSVSYKGQGYFAGKVGIGTSSPSNNLDILSTTSGATVSARVGSTATSGANNANLIINNGGTGNATLRFDYESSSNRASIGVPSSTEALFFTTSGDERMRIDSSGNVGIGTTSPSYPLEIRGSSGDGNFVVGNSSGQALQGGYSSGGAASYIQAYNTVSSAFIDLNINGSTVKFGTGSGATERMRIDSSGRLLVGTTSSSGSVSNSAQVVGGLFKSFSGSNGGVSSGTSVTLFTLPNNNATYMVTAQVANTGNAGAYSEVAIVCAIAGGSVSLSASIVKQGSLITISVSGANVQASQGSGVNQTISWTATRIA